MKRYERNISQEMQLDSSFLKKIKEKKFTLDTRIQLLIGCVTMHKPDWKKLEIETEIPAEKWRQYTRGSTKASLDMTEALAAKWPQYAFWLITGVSDEKHGHHAPDPTFSFPGFDGLNEFEDIETKQIPRFARTTEYFKLAAKLAPEQWSWAIDNPIGKPIKKSEEAKDRQFRSNFELLSALSKLKNKELDDVN
jgi:hypothetical protein